jgi:hypothetical protein
MSESHSSRRLGCPRPPRTGGSVARRPRAPCPAWTAPAACRTTVPPRQRGPRRAADHHVKGIVHAHSAICGRLRPRRRASSCYLRCWLCGCLLGLPLGFARAFALCRSAPRELGRTRAARAALPRCLGLRPTSLRSSGANPTPAFRWAPERWRPPATLGPPPGGLGPLCPRAERARHIVPRPPGIQRYLDTKV